jgi:hypothetical protein
MQNSIFFQRTSEVRTDGMMNSGLLSVCSYLLILTELSHPAMQDATSGTTAIETEDAVSQQTTYRN